MLTDVRVRQAKAADRPRKLSDGGGLHLLITPNGAKLWRQAYRYAGKQKTLALGIYPAVMLAAARDQREAAKALLARGIDPAVQKALRKQNTGDTFDAIASEVIAKQAAEGKSPKTLKRLHWLLTLARPLAGRRITDITPPELLAICRTPEAQGNRETARRLRAFFSVVFRYAIATGRAERDQAADLRGALAAPTVVCRPAIIEPTAIGALLRAVDGYEGETTKLALQLLALTFVRPGELRHATWGEIDFQGAVWTIAAARMKKKNRPPHKVPLSAQALAALRRLHALTGNGYYVFPSMRTPNLPISDSALNGALRRLGYRSEEICAHGFRAMASTRLNEMQRFSVDAIERQLAHQDDNASRRPYMRAQFWDERVAMMQVWADYLDGLKSQRRAAA